jgi:Flp pilus assembly protein CpaB
VHEPPRPPLRPRRPWRDRLRRPRAVPWWSAAAVVAIASGVTVARVVTEAEQARGRWGELRPAVVVLADADAGSVLGPDDVEVRHLPAALVPGGALDRPPQRAVTSAAVHAGEVLLAGRLAPAGASAVAALLPPGSRGVAVPGRSGLPLEVGDRVDVLATFDAGLGNEAEPTFAAARRAVVVHVGDDAVSVAVPEQSAARVAYAVAAGTVTLTLSGPR